MKIQHLLSFTLAILFLIGKCNVANAGKTASLEDTKVLELLLNNSDVLLTSAKHCKNASAQFNTKTIADYLAGHWLVHKNKTGKNWIEIRSTAEYKNKKHTGWTAKVMIYQEYEDEEGGEKWLHQRGNGVQLFIKHNNSVDRASFACIGTD